ncbi:MAG TPA: CapA family protein [bacterium]|nr:CapA family protein [bacterium]HNS47936.1 CapA family protein [bacterium]
MRRSWLLIGGAGCLAVLGLLGRGFFGRPEPDRPARISVAAVGDLMPATDFPAGRLPPDDGRGLFDDAAGYLAAADLAFGNLEGPVCEGGACLKPLNRAGWHAFRIPPRYAPRLAAAGFDVFSLANNHVRDFGPAGYEATRAALEKAGIGYADAEGQLAAFRVRGRRVAVAAYYYGGGERSILRPEVPWSEIRRLDRDYDIVIVSAHGGAEGPAALRLPFRPEYYLGEARGDLAAFGRGAVEAGADLVLMHGPHVPRALEVYRGRLIAYSLGNFCTTGDFGLDGAAGLAPLLWVELDGRGRYLGHTVYSFRQAPGRGPKLDETDAAAELVDRLSRLDFPGRPVSQTGD